MPNWCNNTTTFTHEDPLEIQRLVKAFNEERLFNEFVTCPPALHETVEMGEGYKERHEAKEVANQEAYGYDSWYDWNLTHWGTKWDVGADYEYEIDPLDPLTITICFDTAWSPPIEFYEAMTDMGWTIKGYYYEPGMSFCGLFDDGVNEEYDINGDADWVGDHIPSAIDEMFAISESMSQWDEEKQMDDDTYAADEEENDTSKDSAK
jgi:hypothetical protein